MAETRRNAWGSRERSDQGIVGWPALITLLGVAASVWLWMLLIDRQQQLIEAQFRLDAEERISAIHRQMDQYVDALEAVGAFYAGSARVERGEFAAFVSPMLERFPGLETVQWIVPIRPADAASVAEAAGIEPFEIFEMREDGRRVAAANRDAHYVTLFAAPEQWWEEFVGFDHASDPRRLSAIEQAIARGGVAASDRLQPNGAEQGGCRIALALPTPVPSNEAVGERGVLMATVRVDAIVARALSYLRPAGIDVRLIDESAGVSGLVLHQEPAECEKTGEPLPADPGWEPPMREAEVIDLADRRWVVVCTPTESYIAARRAWTPLMLPVMGAIGSLLVGSYAGVLRDRRRAVESQVAQRTAELEQANADLRAMVAERRRAEQRLATTAEELVRSNQELEQFAYVASHDLQEPLRMVAGYVQLLQSRYAGKLDAEAEAFIGQAVEGAERMRRLIDDLLAYARVDRQPLEARPVDMNAVVAQAWENLAAATSEARATLKTDRLPTVVGDATQLTAVMQNLLANAVKFRHEDQAPVIHVWGEATGDGHKFTVADNGIGIDGHDRQDVFMVFHRLHSRDAYPGSGLGLAICKRIVERHGGEIWFEPNPTGGTRFHFTIRPQ